MGKQQQLGMLPEVSGNEAEGKTVRTPLFQHCRGWGGGCVCVCVCREGFLAESVMDGFGGPLKKLPSGQTEV